MLLTTRTWGIEIELNCKVQEEFKHGKTSAVGQYMADQFTYPYKKILAPGTKLIPLPPGWTFSHDASCGAEFISPPLCNSEHIRPMLKAIAESGIQYTFKNTGFHVHVGAGDLSEEQILNVVRFCRYFERAIYSYCAPRRRRSKYCQSVGKNDYDLAIAIAETDGEQDRYRGCNFASIVRHGTIEFRYAEGTDNFERMESLIDLFTCIVDIGKNSMRYQIPNNTAIKRVALLDLLPVSNETRRRLLLQNGWKYNQFMPPAVV